MVWQAILMSMATGIIKMAMPKISTELRKMIIEAVEKWEIYAKSTPYNWDNMVVAALHGILCITDESPNKSPVTAEPFNPGLGGA